MFWFVRYDYRGEVVLLSILQEVVAANQVFNVLELKPLSKFKMEVRFVLKKPK